MSICFYLIFLYTTITTCFCEKQILYDSFDNPQLFTTNGKWIYDNIEKVFKVHGGSSDDTLQTSREIDYEFLNLHAVYLNITYVLFNKKKLNLNVTGYTKVMGGVTPSMASYTLPPLPTQDINIAISKEIQLKNATMATSIEISCQEGFSGQINRVVLYTHYCPTETYGNAFFPNTFSNPNSGIYVDGICANGSSPIMSPPYLICRADGGYERGRIFYPCICDKGMGNHNDTCQGNKVK